MEMTCAVSVTVTGNLVSTTVDAPGLLLSFLQCHDRLFYATNAIDRDSRRTDARATVARFADILLTCPPVASTSVPRDCAVTGQALLLQQLVLPLLVAQQWIAQLGLLHYTLLLWSTSRWSGWIEMPPHRIADLLQPTCSVIHACAVVQLRRFQPRAWQTRRWATSNFVCNRADRLVVVLVALFALLGDRRQRHHRRSSDPGLLLSLVSRPGRQRADAFKLDYLARCSGHISGRVRCTAFGLTSLQSQFVNHRLLMPFESRAENHLAAVASHLIVSHRLVPFLPVFPAQAATRICFHHVRVAAVGTGLREKLQ